MGSTTTFTCDTCGATAPGVPGHYDYHDPPKGWTWFWGSTCKGPHACSGECWEAVQWKRRTTDGKVYLPDSHERRARADAEAKERHAASVREITATPERPARTVKRKHVYFVRRGEDGPVKIGISSNVAARVKQLQGSAAERLCVLAEAPGTEEDEARLHARFGVYRLTGEWFASHADILTYAAQVAERKAL
jgi:hypothetical protein